MATLSKGYSFGATETVTNAKLSSLVDSATISGIMNADVAAGAAIASSKVNYTGSGIPTTGGANTFTALNTFSGGLTSSGATILSGSTTLSGDIVGLKGSVNYLISGGGAAIATGIKGDISFPFDKSINISSILGGLKILISFCKPVVFIILPLNVFINSLEAEDQVR